MARCLPRITYTTSATVSGRITDPQGKAVVRAIVKLALPIGPTAVEVRTDGVGQYSIPEITAGSYRLIVSAAGFAAVTKTSR